MDASTGDLVWYVAYGSNLCLERFRCYLAGGTPAGGARAYPGCRDAADPLASRPVTLPGGLYFALESSVWGGGMAFYDPAATGEVAARAHLVTGEQLLDVLCQEMRRAPGSLAGLGEPVAAGRWSLGGGRYETVLDCGELEGVAMRTFTSPARLPDADLRPPSAAYLRVLAAGLSEAHGWPRAKAAAYLCRWPGACGHVDPAVLLDGEAGPPR